MQDATEALAESARAAGVTFGAHLTEDGETQDQLADETRERLLAEKYVAGQVKIEEPTAAEVKDWYEQHRAEFDQPAQVHALQILASSAGEAKDLLDQLRRGVPFDEVARASSLSPDARSGGDLGFFARGTMPKVFDDTCFALRPGQLSGVIQSSYGFHIFKLLERRAPKRGTLEGARTEVLRRLTQERRIAAERVLLASLRAQAKVQIDEAVLAQLH